MCRTSKCAFDSPRKLDWREPVGGVEVVLARVVNDSDVAAVPSKRVGPQLVELSNLEIGGVVSAQADEESSCGGAHGATPGTA